MSSAQDLDRLLFRAPIRVIDSSNDVIASFQSLDRAAASIEAGLGASYFATLAPGVAGVDVDLDDFDEAEALLTQLTEWCDDHSVWWCSRSSGGGPGRFHLIAVPGELLPALRGEVLDLRRHWNLSQRQLDWRSTLRPLCAPHRRTGQVSVPAASGVRLAALQHGAGSHRLGVAAPRPARPNAAQPLVEQVAGTFELRPLSADLWSRLRQPGPAYAADKSQFELLVTAELKGAGYTCDEAWKVLADPAYRVGSKARRRGQEWWKTYVWSKAQPPAQLQPGQRPRLPRSYTDGYDWQYLTLPLVGAVRRVWSRWTPRERHSTEHVAAAVSEYFTSRRTLAAVPAAERTVSEDTGLDRTTARGALRRLVDADVLVSVERFAYGQEEGQGRSANTYAPNLLALDFSDRSPTPPPSLHTPPPCHPLWLGLAPGSLSLWITTALQDDLTPENLRTGAGYEPPANGHLSTRQKELLEARLTALQHRDLLSCRAGRWRLKETHRRPTAPKAGWGRWRELRRQYATERDAFRTARAADRERFRGEWERGRARATAKRCSADRIRRDQWWRSLNPAERRRRRAAWREIYADLNPVDQERRRALLQARRTEAELYDREVMLAVDWQAAYAA